MMELDKEYVESVNEAIKALCKSADEFLEALQIAVEKTAEKIADIFDEILASIKKNAIKEIHCTPYVPKCKESVMCVKRIIPNARSRC